METLLKANEVTKIYAKGQRPSLNKVSFNVAESEFIAIMGASGSGKTTLLNVLSTIDTPTSGSIVINGVNLKQLSDTGAADFRRDNLGFIFQEYFLLDSLTIRENISVPLTLQKLSPEKIEKMVQSLAERFGIASQLDKYPNELSGGQRQRASAARAIVKQPNILFADEPTGYRAKTRFAKFFNLPELIALFKESADIQTPDMLKLPVPEAEYENVVLKPSEYQQDMVSSLADRAEKVRNRLVEPYQDNMLKITNDGRKLALDQRLINDMLPDNETSKAATCVGKAFEIWEQTKEQKSTQLIFCDLSTPKGDGTFNVYEDIKNKLVEKGVPPEEIAFIHEANTEIRKAELFGKVRSGQVRFLLGSTQKMGAGTNVQDRLIALHHLDVPWRPSDIEQQEGRILRQGNLNPKVKIFRYVTEGTFDSYSWQLIENKQKFIGQIMTSKSPVRSCEDVDEAALTYAEVKALATGNPYIKEKMDLDIQVSKLKLMKGNHTSQKYKLEDNIAKHYPQQIAILKERISGMTADIQTAKANLPADKEQFLMKVGDKFYTDKKEAGAALVEMCKEMKTVNVPATIGEYAGFKMAVSFDSFNHKFVMNLKGQLSHNLEVGSDPLGNIARINHALESMPKQLAEAQTKLETVERQLETAKVEVTKPFAQEAELAEKLERLSALNALLNMDEKGDDALGMDDAPEEENEGQETSGHDVQKSGQEETISERPEMEEKAANIPIPYPVENARHDYSVGNGGLRVAAAMADKPVQRASLKEKLEAFKVKAAGNEKQEKYKEKGKEKTL